ncbi:MAG TPA: NAD(P)-binding domain-containing protein [Candidatus Eisenbacteria bacterium]|nr:NAD(P)-binding domain-containing protein [Candidatus Eisenbacteria bacterium]
METLITLLAFGLITAVSIAWHMRATKRKAARACPPGGRACAGCGAACPAGAERCPSCGVPLQIYDVVGAPVVSGENAAGGGVAHALVRSDSCVGCGACVAVCPEPGAIRLEGKLAVVNKTLCKGHGECVKACPVGGIFLSTGAAVQRVEVPRLGAHFETDVPGLFVVGELGGRGLIRNAVNEGRVAVEEIARRAAAGARSDRPDVYDVLIVGSGPAGLSAGLEAHRANLRYLILERGNLADSIRRYPRHKILMAEPVKIPLYGELWVSDASKETLLQVWQTIIERTGLRVDTGQEVNEIAKGPDGFLVRTPSRTCAARHVVLALGRRGTPRKLGVPGESLPHVFYDIVEMEAFKGSRVLVVGGGDSAIESAVGLAHQQGTKVHLSYRGETFGRIKERNREKLDALAKAGRIEVMLRSQVKEIGAQSTVVEIDGGWRTLPLDYVVVRIGGEAPYDLLRRAGISIVMKELSVSGAEERAVA